MKKKMLIPPLLAVLALSACGKSDTPSAPPAPAPVVQTPPAPSPPPMEAPPPAPAPAAEAAPAPAEPPMASAPPPAMPSSGSGETYVVVKGDTLYSIAKAHNVTPHDLAQWNDLSNPDMLLVGKELRLSASK